MAKIVIISPREFQPPLETTSFRSRMSIYGVVSVATYMQSRGHEVKVFCEFSGARVDWNAVREADYVAFSFLSYCAPRSYDMADRARTEFGKPVVMGGSHPSVMPEDALEHADYVVRNEGERAFAELIDCLERGGAVADVRGVSYRGPDGRCVHNPDMPFEVDLDFPLDWRLLPDFRPQRLSWIARDALRNAMPRVPMPVVQASRGCPGGCRFCIVKYQLGTKCRKKSIETVLHDVEQCVRLFKTPYLLFADNDLSLDPAFTYELFDRMLRTYGPSLRPYIFGRIDICREPDLLRLLEKFDHSTLGLGIESIFDDALGELNKKQSARDVFDAIAELRKYRLSINGLFMFGTDCDTRESIRRTVDFCIREKFFSVGFFAVYDFPSREKVLGQPQMIADDYFIHRDWRFYNLSFAVHFPKLMRPSELQQEIFDGYRRFNARSPDSMFQFLPTVRTSNRYVEYLRAVEKPYYGPDGRRLDERLAGRTLRDLPARVDIDVPGWEIYAETVLFLARNLLRAKSWRLLKGVVLPRRRSPDT